MGVPALADVSIDNAPDGPLDLADAAPAEYTLPPLARRPPLLELRLPDGTPPDGGRANRGAGANGGTAPAPEPPAPAASSTSVRALSVDASPMSAAKPVGSMIVRDCASCAARCSSVCFRAEDTSDMTICFMVFCLEARNSFGAVPSTSPNPMAITIFMVVNTGERFMDCSSEDSISYLCSSHG